MQNVAKGLALATMAATTNSAMELSGKKALSGRGFLESTLFIRLVVACAFTLAAACVFLLRPGWGDLFGSESPRALADPSFLLYAVVATGLVTSAILLYYRAIQISPLSLTIPLFGFTPVFLLFTNALATGRLPSPATAEGVLIVVLGSILLKWPERSEGWRATVSAVFRDPGSRYMLLASLLLAITNPLDQKLVRLAGPLSYAWLYSTLCLGFVALVQLFVPKGASALRPRTGWILAAGLFDAATLLLHLASIRYIDVVITIAIKRSGMLLAVLAGWLFFGEEVRQRFPAACIILVGAQMLYVDSGPHGRIAAVVLVVMLVAFWFRRQRISQLVRAES